MSADHLGETLSAYVDGELGDVERAEVADHLASCRSCRREHDLLVETRELLRGLPEVRPAFGVFRRLLPRSVSWRLNLATIALAVVAAGAFVAALAVTGGLDSLPIRPAIEQHAQRHVAMADSTVSEAGSAPDASESTPPANPEEFELMPAAEGVPLVLATGSLGPAYEAAAAWWNADDGVVHLMFRAGTEEISVFAEEGQVAWSRLPSDGRQSLVSGERVWRTEDRGLVVVVVEHDDLVFTLVASSSRGELTAVAADLPQARSLGAGERLRRASSNLVEIFGLG